MRSIWTFALILMLSAGAKSHPRIVPPALPQPALPVPIVRPPFLIGGIPADDFYNQFLYQLVGKCGVNAVIHRFPSSDTVKVGVNRKGQDVLAELKVIMTKDHSYSARYEEVDVIRYTASGFTWSKSRTRVVRGTWVVVENRLELFGLGVATGVQYDNDPAMLLTMNTDLITPGFQDHVLLMSIVDADYMPIPDLNLCLRK